MRKTRVWARLLGLQGAVVEDVELSDKGQVVVAVRPRHRERERCGICRRRSPGFDLGEGRRRWRALDLGTTFVYLEADAPRVSCPEHGVTVCAVPWARHDSRFTRALEDQLAWLAVNTSKSAVAELMRVAWRSVGRVCERVAEEPGAASIPSTSSRSPPRRSTRSAARSGTRPAAKAKARLPPNSRAPASRSGKNPENLTTRQQSKLADIERVNRPLYRAYLLKEQLRQIYRPPAREAVALLEQWLSWARRCRLRPFVKLARTITAQREGIVAAIESGLSNARVEAINTQIRLIARRAFGFHSPEALISLAMLKLGGLCPPLPGRVTVTGPTETSGEPDIGCCSLNEEDEEQTTWGSRPP